MIVFHHIPKSAGTTISTAIIEANTAPSLIVGSEGLGAHDQSAIPDLAFLSGHIPYSDVSQLLAGRETSHFSILRHPLERLISHFEMAYRDNDLFREEICYKEKWTHGFDLFLDRFIEVPSLNNLMCSYFHPSRRFYDAVSVISGVFDFVGSMDHLEVVSDYLAMRLPELDLVAPTTLPKLNVSAKNEPFWRTMRGATLDRVRDTNREDFLLFEWLTERHGGAFHRA